MVAEYRSPPRRAFFSRTASLKRLQSAVGDHLETPSHKPEEETRRENEQVFPLHSQLLLHELVHAGVVVGTEIK